MNGRALRSPLVAVPGKAATGIAGFDEITGGGLPRGRSTLLIGGPGSGKTIFALQFLAHGAQGNEPGIFVAFEEASKRIVANAGSFGWNLAALRRKKLFFLDAQPMPDLVQSGNFDLSGMLAALEAQTKTMGARRSGDRQGGAVARPHPDAGAARGRCGSSGAEVSPAMSRRVLYKFRLYVAGDAHNSAQAVANLTKLCRAHRPGRYDIDVVDVFKEPRVAMADGILMTPTLVRLAPSPIRRIVGTLNDPGPVLQALGVDPVAA